MSLAMGENPHYDAAVERQMAATRARHALVEDDFKHEQLKAGLRKELDLALLREERAKIALDEAKAEARKARAALTRADTDLRTHRRAENARLQQEAEAVGAKTYATNTPCRNGHHSPRYTSSGACVLCDKIGWEGGKLKGSIDHDAADQ